MSICSVQLAKLGSERPFVGPEPACSMAVGVAKKLSGTGQTEIIKNTGILNRTQPGKGTHTRTLCQKNQGTAKFKQKSVMVGSRTLLPKKTLFSKWNLQTVLFMKDA
jgi:hypothetical protein